ncbi:MAG: glycosyltransferase family 4 protein [Enterobacteriaceae bacterium]
MKILLVNRALGTLFGGGESFDYHAARYLAARGHQVTIVTAKALFKPALHYPEVNIIYLTCPNFRRLAYMTERISSKLSAIFYRLDNFIFEYAVFRWYRKLPAKSFDVVQCCSLFRLPQKLIKYHKQPVISWLPGPPSRRVCRELLQLVKEPLFKLFTHGSTEWKLLELGLIKDSDYLVIEPGVELQYIDNMAAERSFWREKLDLSSDDLLGITTARLVAVKNHRFLLEALAKVKQRGIMWHWIIVGDGPLESELKKYVQLLGISDQIHFLGYQPQHIIHHWLAAADIFTLTSYYESFSIASIEAMAHRLPVIGTDVGYLKILISNAKAGEVVPNMDVENLVTLLSKLTDAERRKAYGNSGREFVKDLDWPRISTKLESIYLKLFFK